jgi:COP9 signalosome complex subunit 7
MEGSPLTQFVVLAQTAQGAACQALVRQALEHSAVFNFGELLDCPNVQALAAAAESQRLVEVLRIFAFGTYSDYKARQTELPELTPAQKHKLQLLTVVSMATKDKYIKFADLQAAVDVHSQRELEDLIIESVYQNLISGKMDQENQCLIIESSSCRDCRDEDIDDIISTLSWWHDSAQKTVSSLDGMVQHTQNSFEKHKSTREDLEKLVQSTRESLKEGDGGKGGDGAGCTRMSTDDADEESKRAKSTRGRWMGSLGGASSRGKH